MSLIKLLIESKSSIQKVLDSNKAYSILDSVAGGTWSAGGCAILAQALEIAYDLKPYVLIDQNGMVEHMVAVNEKNNMAIDYDGFLPLHSKIKQFQKLEGLEHKTITAEPYTNQDLGDIVIDKNASLQLSKLLTGKK